MFNAQKLLDQFLGGGVAGSGAAGPGAAGPGAAGAPGSGGGLSSLGGSSGVGGMLGDLQRRASANPLVSGALAGGLASILLGSRGGREITGTAVKYGGMALIGGLAYKAYQDYQARQAGAPPPAPGQASEPELLPPPRDTLFMPAADEAEDRARLLLTAMISAAKADGHIDAAEQKHIFDRVGTLGLDAEAKAYLMDQLSAPLDLDGIVKAARGPEVATEVYAASLLAIDPDHPAEKAYLQMLAARLGLADGLVQEIHRTTEAARVPA